MLRMLTHDRLSDSNIHKEVQKCEKLSGDIHIGFNVDQGPL